MTENLGTCACVFAMLFMSLARAEAQEGDATGKATGSAIATTDPANVEHPSPEDARRLTASAGETLSLPRVKSLSTAAARELATYRQESGTCTHTVCIPVLEEKTVTYSVMVPYSEEKTAADGKVFTVQKCRPEERTRTFTVTKCVPESRTHACPLTLQLDGLASADPEVLAALARHDGNLHLAGLEALSIDGASRLATHRGGTLALDGLVILNDDVAAILASHEGPLSLKGVKQASEQALAALEGRSVALPPEFQAPPREKE